MSRPLRSSPVVVRPLTAAIIGVLVSSAPLAAHAANAGADAPSGSAPAATAPSGATDALARADADMKAVLAAHQQMGAKPIATLTPSQARNQPTPADAVKRVLQQKGEKAPQPSVRKVDLKYAAAAGEQPMRIYTPTNATAGAALPVIVYFHGGGWVIADLDTYDASAAALSAQANAIVMSAEYRHAPEHKFPAAHEDAVAAYRWALSNAARHGGDPAKIAVAGESAGGNLAANVAIAARDGNLQKPVAMLLVYPVAGTDMNTPSYRENANARPLDKAAMQWFVKNATDPSDAEDPRLNLVAANLKGLPPATIITAEIDPLRSEGEQLAKKLKSAGVPVTYRNYDGVTHEFFGMAAAVADAKDAQALAARQLQQAFGGTTRSAEAGSRPASTSR
jgi:acetyl esterase/lipase